MLSFYQLPIEKTFLFTQTKLSSIFEYKQNTSTIFVICTFNFPTVKSNRYTEKISINELPLPIHNQTVFLNYHQNQSCNKQKSQNTDTPPCTLLRQKKQEQDHHQCCTDYHLCNSKPEEEAWQLYHTYIFLLALLINLFCFFPCQLSYEI